MTSAMYSVASIDSQKIESGWDNPQGLRMGDFHGRVSGENSLDGAKLPGRCCALIVSALCGGWNPKHRFFKLLVRKQHSAFLRGLLTKQGSWGKSQ